MKKIMAILIALAICVGCFPCVMKAASAAEAATSYAGGTGTKDDPFLISNAAELLYFNERCGATGDFDNCGQALGWENYHGAYFKLTANIDCSSITKWTPCSFAGHFDGSGYTISNLNIGYTSLESGRYNYAGFFETLYDGSISNIRFEKVNVTIPSDMSVSYNYPSVYMGIVAGEIYYAAVENVMVEDCIVAKETGIGYWPTTCIGGLAGHADGAYFNRCSVRNTAISSIKGYVGGLVGDMDSLYYDVKDFKDAGYLFRFGGDTGKFGIENSMIDDESSVAVSNDYGTVGGMIGWLCPRKHDKVNTCPVFVLKNNYSQAAITINQSASSMGAGGLVGEISYTEHPVEIENCYFAGSITDNLTTRTGKGAIVGFTTRNDAQSITLNHCYGLTSLRLDLLGEDRLYNVSYGGNSILEQAGCAGFDDAGVLDTEVLNKETVLDALNAWATQQESGNYNYWGENKQDSKYPVFAHPVTFVPNGGTGIMTDVYAVYGTQISLPVCTFVAPDGMQFAGWALSVNGEPVQGSVTVNGAVSLYALWQPIQGNPVPNPETAPVTDSPSLPKTGDTTPIAMLCMLACMSLAGMWISLRRRSA